MLNRFAVLSVLIVSSVAAHAIPISGAFAATGGDAYTSSTLTFNGPSAGGGLGTISGGVTPATPTGTFLTYLGAGGGEPVTYFPAFPTSTPLPYFNGPNLVPPAIYAPGQTGVELFTVSGGGEMFNFYMTDYNANYTAGTPTCPVSCLAVTGDGYYTGTGAVTFTNSPGQFTFTSQYLSLQSANTSFSASANTISSASPEPSSLALLGTGLLGAVGFARRKLMA